LLYKRLNNSVRKEIMMPPTPKIPRVMKILLVEDDQADAVLVFEAFKNFKRPVELIRVKDGEEALAYLRKEDKYAGVPAPDLILLDLNMPKKGGLEVLEELKNDSLLNEIPVLILTSSQADSDVRKAYASRANFYIVKPHDFPAFCEAMKFVEDIWLPTLQHPDPS
jgi:CheY-like chemotaxis protein